DGPGQLEWSDADRALPDADRNRLARVPGRAEGRLFPLPAGDQTGVLVGKIDPGPAAETHGRRELGDPVDSEPVAHLVEKHVARMDQGVVQRDMTMAPSFPTRETVPIVGRVAGTVHGLTLVNHVRGESGGGHHDLEHRS